MNSVVCLIGIDGSGKTTLCKLLVQELRSRGIPSRYVYGRFLPKIMAPVFKITSTLMPGQDKKQKHRNTRLASKRQLLGNSVASKIFIIGVLLDQILQILLKVYLPSAFKREVIVCDRYFHDTVLIDIAIPCGFDYNAVVRFVKRYLPLFPRIQMLFLVVVPATIAFRRKKDISSMKELQRLSKSYLYTAKYFGATTIDGTKSPTELMPLLLDKLESAGMLLNRTRRVQDDLKE
jgi:thymidylate kinase